MSEKKSTKQDDILRLMKCRGKKGLTQADAYMLFHTTRLAVHIDKLRRKGYNIETIMETGKDKYGSYQYGRYVLVEGEK